MSLWGLFFCFLYSFYSTTCHDFCLQVCYFLFLPESSLIKECTLAFLCIFCPLFFHSSCVNSWVTLTFWSLWITLLWELVYKELFMAFFEFLLVYSPSWIYCFSCIDSDCPCPCPFEDLPWFSIGAMPFSISINSMRALDFLYHHILYFKYFITAC